MAFAKIFRPSVTLFAALLALTNASGAWAQDSESDPVLGIDELADDDRGYYQSYAFGQPDDPSEAWTLAYGGRLYDRWWAVLLDEPPAGTHPAYPADGRLEGAETWRCVTCHGWDYRGGDGAYRVSYGFIGGPSLAGQQGAAPEDIVAVLRDDTHGYSQDLIPDDAARAIALFVSKGQTDIAAWIDPASGMFQGDAEAGKGVFQTVCAICHDYDGGAWITGEDNFIHTIGASLTHNPWRGAHKVLNGQTYADMPALRVLDPQTVLNILTYGQSLPPE